MSYKVFKVNFHDGKTAVWITDQCKDLESAKAGAVEKFGSKRVKSVVPNDVKNPFHHLPVSG